MTLLARAVLVTTGFPGAPGINVLHFSEGTSGGGAWGQAVVDDLYAELDSIAAAIKNVGAPNTSRVWEAELGIIDAATGKLVDAKTPSTTPVPQVTASNEPGDLPRAVAALVRLQTTNYINGKRLKGRMFVGPMSGQHVSNDGNFDGTVVAVLEDAFDGVTSGLGPRLAVYHRPTTAGNDGTWGDVITTQVRLEPSYLRSRSV